MRGEGGGARKGYRVATEVYRPLVLDMLKKLFDILKRGKQGGGGGGGDEHQCNENDYVMKCIMRILAFEKQEIAPYSGVVFAELGGVLGEVAKNPQNPMFSHYLFESLGVVVKSVGGGGGRECEERLLPGFEVVLGKDVVEYAPYVFQVFIHFILLLCSNLTLSFSSPPPPPPLPIDYGAYARTRRKRNLSCLH